MNRLTILGLVPMVALAGGCPSVEVDPGEGVDDTTAKGPTVEFDPAKSIIPFPNNLIPRTPDGKLALPAQACESQTSKAIREGVLNKLDGFGTYQAAWQATLTAQADMATVAANVKMFKRVDGTLTPVTNLITAPTMAVRYPDPANCVPTLVPALVIVSPAPLAENTTYDVVITKGLKTTDGTEFGPDGTWLIARSKLAPVVFDGDVVVENNTPLDPTKDADIAQLKQIAGLWAAHVPMLDALDAMGIPRDTTLVAWEATTATVTDPLDPMVTGSVANTLPATGFAGFVFPPGSGITTSGHGEDLLVAKLGAATCAAIGCAAVNDVIGGAFGSKQYQQPVPNPMAGGAPTPGAWSDPVHPVEPSAPLDGQLSVFVIVPKGAVPANGWPTVIFGHGLGSSKESLAVFGPQLASQGFASVAMDFVDHGSRAVQTSNDPAIGCGGNPDPTVLPQCFALFLSTDLAGTRDNIRQTVLDLQRLSKALVTCGTGAGCAQNLGVNFKVDPSKILYTGISLGGIIGSTFTATSPLVKAAVLNVPGVGLVDILENTQTIAIRCTLVNALIDAKVLTGTKWSGAMPTVGLCVEPDQGWKTQPGYAQFSSIARWVLDPADGANFTPKLATKKIMIQEVIGDQVVPNIATEREAALVGLTPAFADEEKLCTDSGSPAPCRVPSAAVLVGAGATGTPNKFIQYKQIAASGQLAPGNDFQHASLLSPVRDANGDPTTAGSLGTVRVQIDAITFLFLNK